VAQQIWEAVRANDKKAVYRYIVNSDVDVNAVYEQACNNSLTLAKVMLLQEQANHENGPNLAGNTLDWSSNGSMNLAATKEGQPMVNLDGCTLLHIACETADIGMVELLLQYGANINATDLRGRTPLHRCILKGRSIIARLLLSRSVFICLSSSYLTQLNL
jgi:Arf-GAP/coiled-coil/ANK repeat/PH domain-containing protein